MPKGISRPSASHPATAPTLLSHLPMLSPMTFSHTHSARPAIETAMKYVLFVESFCASGPPMNSAFAAMKYNRLGRYGRLVVQYVQPVMNPANGPNARLLQTYRPPSSG